LSEQVIVTPLEEGQYGVQVQEGSTSTNHRVRVPPGLVDDLGLSGVDEEQLVRESFSFLLEREPATSILPEFGLDIIPRYFPEYPEEIARRVGAGS